MKNRIWFIIVLVLLFSFCVKNVSASELCSSNGYTVLTVNGIFTTLDGAIYNKDALKFKLKNTFNNQSLNVDFIHNPTHLAGAGDLIDVVEQGLFKQKNDYDLVEMLNDASAKVTTQKLLLVAHSQGNFYANNFYDKVADKEGGVPSQSIGMYGVASPANHVSGGGKYLTSSTDAVINKTRLLGILDVLKANTDIDLQAEINSNGHSFSDIYLKYQGDKIISDIKYSLDKLKENDEQETQEPCISPQEISTIHKIQGAVLAVADPTAIAAKKGIIGIYNVGAYIANGVKNIGLAVGNTFKNLSANVVASLPDENNLATLSPNILDSTQENPAQNQDNPKLEEKIEDDSGAEATPPPLPLPTATDVLIHNDVPTAPVVSDVPTIPTTPVVFHHGNSGSASAPQPEPESLPKEDPISSPSLPPKEEVVPVAPPVDETPPVAPPVDETPIVVPPIDENPPVITSNILYSQPDYSTEISSDNISSFASFTGASGHIQSIKFAYNDHGNSTGHFIGLSVVDVTTGTNYYGSYDGETCGDVYESKGVNAPIIVELDSSVKYKEHPCTGPELTLDPTHTYGVALFRNHGGSDTHRFYGSSNDNNSAYLHITDDRFPSTGKSIKVFNFSQFGAVGTIDEVNKNISITVPFGADITALTPVIKISGGASIAPNIDASLDFTNPVNYLVTAEDGLIQSYTVTVLKHSNVAYSQPDYSTEISSQNISSFNSFSGAMGNISNLKFVYNDHGSSTGHFIGVSVVDRNTGTNYYAVKPGSSVCGDAYESTGVDAPIVVELDSTYQYKQYPCDGQNLVLDPTHTYGVALFRNHGGSDTQRFYGVSNDNDSAYLYIESSGVAVISEPISEPVPDPVPDPVLDPAPDPIPDIITPSIMSYTFNDVTGDIVTNPLINPISLVLTASENVDWVSIKIENQTDSSIYKIFQSGTGCVDGTNSCTKNWNGILSSGGLLQNGTYKIKVHIKDLAGNDFNDYLSSYVITVDTSI